MPSTGDSAFLCQVALNLSIMKVPDNNRRNVDCENRALATGRIVKGPSCMGPIRLAWPVNGHGLLAPPGVTSCEPPVDFGPGVTPVLLPLPECGELLADSERCDASVSAVTESGLIIIVTGFPSEFLAWTKNEEGLMVMSVYPALLRSVRSFCAMCMFAALVAAESAFASVELDCIGLAGFPGAPFVGPLPASFVAVAPTVGPLPASP
jgi:hypothetical protein